MVKFISKPVQAGVRPTQIGAALTAQKRIYRAVAVGAKVLVAMTVWMAVVAAHVHAQPPLPQSGDLSGSYISWGGSYSGPYMLTGNTSIQVWGTTTITGVIGGSSGYSLTISGSAGPFILTAANTYNGQTIVNNSTLQIGNGTSGSINNTSGVTVSEINSILRFDLSGDVTFSKVIEGAGKVEVKTTGILYFTGTNTYTGTTTIEKGSLFLGNNTSTGSVAGDIIINTGERLVFQRSNEYTYSKVISGGGLIWQLGTGKIILTGVNTYEGETWINNGTLQIGNGSTGSINGTLSVSNNGTLCFQPGFYMTFAKKITGAGKVEIKGTYDVDFTADNTYTGTTTIDSGAILNIGYDNTPTGAIAGDIINNGSLRFWRSNAYTYSGKISGTGNVYQYGQSSASTITLTGANTYTGITSIDGPLVLGSGGTIANSSSVTFRPYVNAKLTITGNKTIKALNSESTMSNFAGTVDLGGNTLTIGTSGGSDGGGTFRGVFAGTGGVAKNGTETFTFTGTDNTATGNFACNQGTVVLEGNWAGAFTQAAGTTLDIKGNVSLGSSSGAVTLQGGDIYMNLTTSPPSKLTAAGAVAASGTTTLHVTTDDVTNQTIIQAASGLGSATPFALDMPGYTASLTATGTELQLTATATDVIPPIPGDGVNGTAAYTNANLSWTAATDDETPPENLRYYVYQSASDNITTVADCETNGTLLNDGGSINITAYDVTALTPQTTYYFNVVVADMTNNKAAYIPKELTTGVEPTIVSIAISPETATVQPGGTQQFTATVVAEGGADESVTWSVAENYSTLTTITADGLLTVGSNETAESFTVRVISVFDPTFFAEATVTIYTGSDPKVLGVTISPKTATVGEGKTQQFTVTVNAVNGADESVTWSLTGNYSTLTTVSATGLLTVGDNETAATLTVTVVSVFDPTISDEATVSVGSVGIVETPFMASVQVYPNPTSGELRVESGELRVESVEIYDVFGKNVSRLTSHISHPISIDISFLPSGIYFLRITTENGTVTKKVVKQ